ncbi:ABC transporter ATP-binding protein [Halomicroarcula sp. GCM10025709]|uniref:ABC transporter ATP-binding protein n=1 Tax=Haloarcula TaxID=2237 RepID=UPI0024C301EA|nr:ABC transporter ATP-binding protein [Halomicroarcula sp. YJ-61-S]
MTDEPFLTATDLTREFGDVTALSGATVSIDPDGITALVGPNGSGKTTLLRLLAGVDTPTSGTVDYDGPDSERRIGYLQQRPSFRPGFTVRETIAFYADLVDADPDRLLERVGLDAVPDRPVEGLSGGMTRLLGIAQALAGDPPVVVLDEPASGLDPAMSGRVFDIVTDIASDGRAVVLSSHELPLVGRAADEVVVLEAGGVVTTASPAEIEARTGGPLHETFTAVLDGDAGVVSATEGDR